jgi:hypothetical protein
VSAALACAIQQKISFLKERAEQAVNSANHRYYILMPKGVDWGSPRFLSSSIYCNNTLAYRDDTGNGYGAESWTLVPVAGKTNTYNIINPYGRTNCPSVFLSVNPCGNGDNSVNMASSDDGSGRQQFLLTPVSGQNDIYNIQVAGGRSGCNTFLSVP